MRSRLWSHLLGIFILLSLAGDRWSHYSKISTPFGSFLDFSLKHELCWIQCIAMNGLRQMGENSLWSAMSSEYFSKMVPYVLLLLFQEQGQQKPAAANGLWFMWRRTFEVCVF